MTLLAQQGGLNELARGLSLIVVSVTVLSAATLHAAAYAAYTLPFALTIRGKRPYWMIAAPIVAWLGVLLGCFLAVKVCGEWLANGKLAAAACLACFIASALLAGYVVWTGRTALLATAPIVGMMVFMPFAIVGFWPIAFGGWHVAAFGMTLIWRYRPSMR